MAAMSKPTEKKLTPDEARELHSLADRWAAAAFAEGLRPYSDPDAPRLRQEVADAHNALMRHLRDMTDGYAS
jgi:hypothetical protein